MKLCENKRTEDPDWLVCHCLQTGPQWLSKERVDLSMQRNPNTYNLLSSSRAVTIPSSLTCSVQEFFIPLFRRKAGLTTTFVILMQNLNQWYHTKQVHVFIGNFKSGDGAIQNEDEKLVVPWTHYVPSSPYWDNGNVMQRPQAHVARDTLAGSWSWEWK